MDAKQSPKTVKTEAHDAHQPSGSTTRLDQLARLLARIAAREHLDAQANAMEPEHAQE